jgi:uncharacterized coiled-coil protein SlyX
MVIAQMQNRLNNLEAKLKAQNDYMSMLHSHLTKR